MNNIKIKKKKRLEETESLFICYKGKNQFICFEIKKKKSLNPQKKKKKKKKMKLLLLSSLIIFTIANGELSTL